MDTLILTPLDWALLAVLVVSVLIGLWRGLVFELLSLLAWAAAWFVAQVWGPALAEALPMGAAGSTSRLLTGVVLAFVGTLIACSLLARLARLLIAATPLSLIDRLLGAGFGLARGLLILMAAASLLALTPAGKSATWQASTGAGWLSLAVQTLRPLMPDGMARWTGA